MGKLKRVLQLHDKVTATDHFGYQVTGIITRITEHWLEVTAPDRKYVLVQPNQVHRYLGHYQVQKPPDNKFRIGDVVKRPGGREQVQITNFSKPDENYIKAVFNVGWRCGSWYSEAEIEFVSRPQE